MSLSVSVSIILYNEAVSVLSLAGVTHPRYDSGLYA